MLSHDGFAFFAAPHGTVGLVEPLDLPIVMGQFMGVRGESHIIGEVFGSVITCEMTLQGYANEGLLVTALATLSGKVGKLTGTLTVTGPDATTTYARCTLLPFQLKPVDDMGNTRFWDGSGANGWVSFVRLFWRQRA